MEFIYASILIYFIISLFLSISAIIDDNMMDIALELNVLLFISHPVKYICKCINNDSMNIFGKLLFCILPIIIFIGPIIFCKILQFICYMVAMIISLGFK